MLQYRRNDPSRRRRIKRDLASAPKKGVAGLRMESAPAPLAVPSGDDQEDQDNQDDHDHDNTGDTGDNSVIEALDSLNIRDTQDDDEN